MGDTSNNKQNKPLDLDLSVRHESIFADPEISLKKDEGRVIELEITPPPLSINETPHSFTFQGLRFDFDAETGLHKRQDGMMLYDAETDTLIPVTATESKVQTQVKTEYQTEYQPGPPRIEPFITEQDLQQQRMMAEMLDIESKAKLRARLRILAALAVALLVLFMAVGFYAILRAVNYAALGDAATAAIAPVVYYVLLAAASIIGLLALLAFVKSLLANRAALTPESDPVYMPHSGYTPSNNAPGSTVNVTNINVGQQGNSTGNGLQQLVNTRNL